MWSHAAGNCSGAADNDYCGFETLVTVPVGAVLGTVIGAAIGAGNKHRWEAVPLVSLRF